MSISATTPEKPHKQPSFDEFDRLTTALVTPVLAAFGFQPDASVYGGLWYAKAYRKGDERLKANYELPGDYFEIALARVPDNERGHPVQFICERLGRPHEQYRDEPGRPFDQRLRAVLLLMQEQLADILSGQAVFQFTPDDARQRLAQWHRMEQILLGRLETLLSPRGYLKSSHADGHPHNSHHEFRRLRSSGWVALELDMAAGYWGSGVNVYVSVGFDPDEKPPAPTRQVSGDNPAVEDRPLYLGLYELAGEPSRHLSLKKGTDADELAQQIFSDFIRLGEPFFDRISTLEQAREQARDFRRHP